MAELKKKLRFSLLCGIKAEPPSPSIAQSAAQPAGHAVTRTPDNQASSRSHRGDRSRKRSSKDHDWSIGQVIPFSDPFKAQFDHWLASEEPWPVVCAMSNYSLRAPHLPPLWRYLSQNERNLLFHDCFRHCLICGANGHILGSCREKFLGRGNTLDPAIVNSDDGEDT